MQQWQVLLYSQTLCLDALSKLSTLKLLAKFTLDENILTKFLKIKILLLLELNNQNFQNIKKKFHYLDFENNFDLHNIFFM